MSRALCRFEASRVITKSSTSKLRLLSTMATSKKIVVPVDNTGLLKFGQTDEAAKKTSWLLQKDLERHHVFFNNSGFHNHIPHHLLSLYGTGAPASLIDHAFQAHRGYQRPAQHVHECVIDDMLSSWDAYLGKEVHYPDFLAFFQREIDAEGWQAVLREYLFDNTPRAEDMLQRMFAGFLHPLIQLMYGVEWEQPAIVAQALAEAAVHSNSLGGFLAEAERRAKEQQQQRELGTSSSSGAGQWSVRELYEMARANEALRGSIRSGDSNKVTDGVLTRSKEDMLRVVERVAVPADQIVIEARTAEMFEACVEMTLAQAVVEAQKRGKEERCDFFLMHHVNASPIFVAINKQGWITVEVKARILEWKIRMDLVQYVARGSPDLNLDAVFAYVPRDATLESRPEDLLPQIHKIDQDSHPIKLARALLICRDIAKKYADKEWARIQDDESWSKMLALLYDSTHRDEHMWVRTGGLDDAWEDVPDRK